MQNSHSTKGLQNEPIAARGLDQLSGLEALGFYVNVLDLFKLAGSALVYRGLGLYASSCPNKESLGELYEILHEWKAILNKLPPEQRARFEVDCPGAFDSMIKSIDEYEEDLEDLSFDLRQNPWARYLPKTKLSRTFNDMSERIRNLDREYKASTKNYRRPLRNQAPDNTAPTLEPTPVGGTPDAVEMLPISANETPNITERRLINQHTIDQTERYRSIIRVCANYSLPPGVQTTYSAIQNLVASLLSRPEDSVTMMPV